MDLKQIFKHCKTTENGDKSFSSTGNVLLDILFMADYFTTHLSDIPKLIKNEKNKLFSRFIRDPRLGLGRKDLGRILMKDQECSFDEITKSGRFDDVWKIAYITENKEYKNTLLKLFYDAISLGNDLAKKWAPRYASKDLIIARKLAKLWNLSKQDYGKFVKCDTVENKLSRHRENEIVFEHVPSLAAIKYAQCFMKKMPEKYQKYLEDVKAGKKELHVSTTNVYDIYKNKANIDAQLFFDQLEKIQGNWLPIVDTSGSMQAYDAMGKAISIGHYLAKTSTYLPDTVITFSSRPTLIELGKTRQEVEGTRYSVGFVPGFKYDLNTSKYINEINSMFIGDCSRTNFGAVMELLLNLDKENSPEFLVVLSDQEFDADSSTSKDETMKLFKAKGFNTKIVWWNFNARNTTCPETDSYGNIFMSGYNPMLLKYLSVGFDGNSFLEKLLDEYNKCINN